MLFLPIPLLSSGPQQPSVFRRTNFAKANQTLNNFLDMVHNELIMTPFLRPVHTCWHLTYRQVDGFPI